MGKDISVEQFETLNDDQVMMLKADENAVQALQPEVKELFDAKVAEIEMRMATEAVGEPTQIDDTCQDAEEQKTPAPLKKMETAIVKLVEKFTPEPVPESFRPP